MSNVEATPTPEEPQRSLNRQFVLEEDEYTAALSQIIARDYFPSLVHLDATNEYLDAVSSKDPHLIQASVRRLQELNDTPVASSSSRRGRNYYETPGQTPWGIGPSDTPLRTPRGDWTASSHAEPPPNKKPKYDTSLSLDGFQARYTSEDNSSFTQILDSENQQRKERYGWAWDAQKRVEASNEKMIEGRERMLIEAAPQTGVREKFRIEMPVTAGLLTDGKEEKEESDRARGKKRQVDDLEEDEEKEEAKEDTTAGALIVRSSDSEVGDVLAPRKDTRSAGVDGWRFKARNSLMFSPDADVSPYQQAPIQKEPEKHPKTIKYGNTRLPEQEESSSARSISAPPSPTRSRINAAIEGTPYRPRSNEDEGFSLVPTVPSPTAAEMGPEAMKQLMTWGTLSATPRIIQSDDPIDAVTADSPFRIAQMSKRETLGHQLSNKASKSLRVKAEMLGLKTPGIYNRTPATTLGNVKRGSMAPPSWTPRRADAPGNLTPAGRRLLQRSTLGTAGAKRAEAMERSAAWDASAKGKERELNQLRWTPTPNAVTRR